ncbi:MAG: hypothetical protein M1830_006752 [Pleopsidium flavum]|nr:MAG: hypothetical protein M1830_006752 [Pleopsidium flavum]
MSGIVSHVVRRGLQATQEHYQSSESEVTTFQIPVWGIVILWISGLAYLGLMAAIRYTYGSVVATLTMIESPTATAYLKTETSVESDDPDAPLIGKDEKAALKEPELLVVKAQPITAKLRTTIQHLRARAGWFSRFRGLQVALVYQVVHVCLTGFFSELFPRGGPTGPCLSAVLAAALLARLPLTWTHVVISDPTNKRWFRRIPSFKSWMQIVPATIVWATAEQLTIALPTVLYRAFDLARWTQNPGEIGDIDETSRKMIVMQFFSVAAVAVGTAVLILIPATVTLKRVQASLLPEEDEAIVPFDRTFGGRVIPEIVGGTGKLGIFEAWRSFEWAARIRLVKVYAKMFAMQVALTVLFAGVCLAELQLIMGDELQKMIMLAQARQSGEDFIYVDPRDN